MEGAHQKVEGCQKSCKDQRPEGKGTGIQKVAYLYFESETNGITSHCKSGMASEESVLEN